MCYPSMPLGSTGGPFGTSSKLIVTLSELVETETVARSSWGYTVTMVIGKRDVDVADAAAFLLGKQPLNQSFDPVDDKIAHGILDARRKPAEGHRRDR